MKLYWIIFLSSLPFQDLCAAPPRPKPTMARQYGTYFGPLETLDTIKEVIQSKHKGAYIRFGDGDLNLATGQKSGTHDWNRNIEREMREAFSLNDPYILKALPLIHKDAADELKLLSSHITEKLYPNHIQLMNKVQSFLGKKIEEHYSAVALPVLSILEPNVCTDFFKFIKNQNCQLFIGNEKIPNKIISLLFGNCAVVPTPPSRKMPNGLAGKSAYTEINSIEKKCLEILCQQNDDYRVVIVSCGNASRVLIKRLWPNVENVFFLDIGSIMDAICGWQTRGYIRQWSPQMKSFTLQLKDALSN